MKVFESYFYVLKSYLKLLQYEKRDFTHDQTIERYGENLKHIVIIPIYTEPYDVIEESVLSVIGTDYRYRESITILLATEARAPDGETHARHIVENHSGK